MYKKIYLEITNQCNLKCSFCPHNKRKSEYITIDNFKIILDKIKDYTAYLYFHVLGEPLLHPNINELIDIASSSFKINITTNGYLINRIKGNQNIRQLNISLQSYSETSSKTLEDYLDDIFNSIDILKEHTYISLRLWVINDHTKKILEYISNKYTINISNNYQDLTLDKNVYISFHKEFIWPNINNDKVYQTGTCYALKDHIAILVDGTVIPCCLDSEGVIKLGNIYKDSIIDIINSNRYQNMLQGFKNNQKCEALCQTCNFIDKKN